MTEVVAHGDKIFFGLRVAGAQAADEASRELKRWQFLTVANGQIVDIRAFDDRNEAAARAGLPS